MARAKRPYLQGYVWHITHRCHKKEHLLKLAKDRQEWPHSGYHEIQKPKIRYGLIDFKRLMGLLPIESRDELKQAHHQWIEEELKKSTLVRQSKWTQSIAVGDKSFVDQIKKRLGIRFKDRKIIEDEDNYHLRDGQTRYGERSRSISENSYYWDLDKKAAEPSISLKMPIFPRKWCL
ncbi:MAG: hypothetical protein JRE92_02655 [Deltaproteobacteria bacterium]|jgi:hypothetical protein|nr:hypothetical protein [Deltaproteobacteria bacterium]